MVIFIDTSNGTNKLLRLFVAIVVSALYLAVLAVVRPFRRDDDAALAYVASLLLICVFASGFILQLCEEGRWGEMTCDDFVGLSSSYTASVFVVSLSAGMFAVFCLFNLFRIVLALATPTLQLASSSRPPVLDLPKKQHFHLFLSHVWSTGQDQATHGPHHACTHRHSDPPRLLHVVPRARAAAAATATRHPHLARRGQLN